LTRRAAQTLELQARVTSLNDRVRLEQNPLVRWNWHAVDSCAVGTSFISNVQLSLLQLDGEMRVGYKLVIQCKVTKLRIAPHFRHLGCKPEFLAHVSPLDDDELA
jgi:hypothetical protein